MYPIIRACEDDQIRDAISWHNQGALIWAIQKFGMERRVLGTPAWNLCVRRTPLVKHYLPWNESFLTKARELLPDANVVHWNGAPVPWGRKDARLA